MVLSSRVTPLRLTPSLFPFNPNGGDASRGRFYQISLSTPRPHVAPALKVLGISGQKNFLVDVLPLGLKDLALEPRYLNIDRIRSPFWG